MEKWREDLAYSELQVHEKTIYSLNDLDNESITRLRAIDTILFDVLKWDKTSVETEKYCRKKGYADYVFSIVGKPCLVLEAKRTGTYFLFPDQLFKPAPYAFGLLARECPEAMSALRQALGYAATLGSRYIAISNGHQWLFSLTFVPDQPLEDRLVYVFESIEGIKDKFRLFWECFSQGGIQKNSVFNRLLESRRFPAPSKLAVKIAGYPQPADRNIFQNELSYILNLVWQIMAQEENSLEFIESCYVCPNAHQDIIGLAKEIIARRRQEDEVLAEHDISSIDKLPHQVANLPAEKPFIILGEVGRGKSSFLKYLRLVTARDMLQKYIQIDLDFLDRPDSADQIANFIYEEIDRQFKEKYSIDVYEDRFVRGVLHLDLIRLKDTPKGKLYAKEENRYREFEVDHIDGLIKDRHTYFTKVIHHLKRGRHCSVALFFDNLDRRDGSIQEKAFLKASAIARDWSSLVFICLRPSTFYKSIESGVFDAIAPKTFTVSQPDLALVLKKRFGYAKTIALGDSGKDVATRVALSKNVAFELPKVARIFESCEFAARKRHGIVPMLEAVSNSNIRRMLEFAKKILSSGYLDTKKILNCIDTTGNYTIPDYEGVKTLLFGDYMHYDPRKSIFINLFDIDHADHKEHFLRYFILKHLSRFSSENLNRGYVHVNDVLQYLSTLGFFRTDIEDTLQYLYANKCIRSHVEGLEWGESIKDVRITSLGHYHINNLVNTFQYMDAVMIDTPILDNTFRNSLNAETDMHYRVERVEQMLQYLTNAAKVIMDKEILSDWREVKRTIDAQIKEIKKTLRKC